MSFLPPKYLVIAEVWDGKKSLPKEYVLVTLLFYNTSDLYKEIPNLKAATVYEVKCNDVTLFAYSAYDEKQRLENDKDYVEFIRLKKIYEPE